MTLVTNAPVHLLGGGVRLQCPRQQLDRGGTPNRQGPPTLARAAPTHGRCALWRGKLGLDAVQPAAKGGMLRNVRHGSIESPFSAQ